MAITERHRGVITTMMHERSYGYLMSSTVQDPKAEIWFHESACNGTFRTLTPGDEVSFKITYPPKGPRAVDVKKLEEK